MTAEALPGVRAQRDDVAASIDEIFVVDPAVRQRRRETMLVISMRIALVVVSLGVWQALSGRKVDKLWISSPSDIWSATLRLIRDQELVHSLQVTLFETVSAFGLGAAFGLMLGVVLGVNRLVARILEPFLVAMYSVPRIALIPLFILWFGIGFQTKVFYAALLVFFPIFMNTVSGIRDVDPDLIDVVRVMGASRIAVIRRILVPSALVWVFTGLRLAIPFALIGVIVAEMFSSNVGLGYLISLSANQFDTAAVFATVFVTTLVGVGLTLIISLLERWLLRWKANQ